MQRLKLVVITKNVIPEEPITMDPMPLTEPTQPAEVVKGELPLPTKEDPSINLDQHKGEANDYAKREYKITKILNHCTLDYTTQYLVRWAESATPTWVNEDAIKADDLMREYHRKRRIQEAHEVDRLQTRDQGFQNLIQALTNLLEKWGDSKRQLSVSVAKRALLANVGKDSGLLHVDKLKDTLQRRIRALKTDNDVVDFLNDCVTNTQIVFRDELKWVRGSVNVDEPPDT